MKHQKIAGSTENTEKEEQPENNNVTNNDVQKENTNNPKTGDNIITSVILFVTSIATIGAFTIVNRKKARE